MRRSMMEEMWGCGVAVVWLREDEGVEAMAFVWSVGSIGSSREASDSHTHLSAHHHRYSQK